ncbi:hypothetical protein AVL62_06340 [Serinicoccus chungangensis]|uniref:Uncharacterized protein n=1 Tax=Serinicoccus chungangensis TaxID=767452 RepID=A0A0W8IH06_9MICO|nr:hypothetical protein [Serinicoccus chungangensis]KUG59295.1 hypothetical protein AVL62_06340 [Serinicoccus chungangensis]
MDGYAVAPGAEVESLLDLLPGLVLDQRAFGPRQLMVAFAAVDGRFLALLHTSRTDPRRSGLEACLLHFWSLGLSDSDMVAAVVLCDEPVEQGESVDLAPFLTTFETAKGLAARHRVHLVDWVSCDDDVYRFARLGSMDPTTEPGWWDVPQ